MKEKNYEKREFVRKTYFDKINFVFWCKLKMNNRRYFNVSPNV